MGKPLQFVRLKTSLKGLMARAIREFDRYADESSDVYHWVVVEHPERTARALEVLGEDLPEEDLARLVTRMPYIIFLFHRAGAPRYIPVEATLAFLSVLNRSEMVTILRQCSDKTQLAPAFGLDADEWVPIFFLVGGVPNLDASFESESPEHCTFLDH